MRFFSQNKKGVTLLMSLVLLAAIGAAAVAITVLIINDIRASFNFDYAVTAYYSAELGIERGLYTIKEKRTSNTLANTVLALNQEDIWNVVDNNSAWESRASANEAYYLGYLELNKSTQIDLFNPDNEEAAPGVESIIIEATDSEERAAEAWIEISYVEWLPLAHIDWEAAEVKKFLYPTNEPVVINDFVGTKAYRLRVKALYDDVTNLKITAYDGDDPSGANIIEIPSRIVLTVTGEYPYSSSQASRQTVTASSAWVAPISGIFDYVLFSERTLKKTK